MTLLGKGFFIWVVSRCEGGNAGAIADLAQQAGFSHVLIKIADGASPYNVDEDSGQDYALPVVQALRQRGIASWGWHYVYGYEPEAEADIAIQRTRQLGMDGYVIDAEAPYKQPNSEQAAVRFMDRLRSGLPNLPVALSSYRYPSMHAIPWQAFLARCDYNMPQVYWEQADNPGEQLQRCLREFEAIQPFRPIIPTGAAYPRGDWQPTAAQIEEFLTTAQNLNMGAANFWEWYNCRTHLPELWNTIGAFYWPPTGQQGSIIQRFFAALNAHNPDQAAELYRENGVHVTANGTVQGTAGIREWYTQFFRSLPGAVFTLVDVSSTSSSVHFSWTAASGGQQAASGRDYLGLVGGMITYHYTSFKR